MNKHLIYSYICELEKELLSVLAYKQFAELIVSEIINQSIIQLHELKGGLSTDERTVKDLISRNINVFFSQTNLSKIEDKLQNWEKRVCYGHRGKMLITPRSLVEFRLATSLELKHVKDEKDAMLHAVRNFSFRSKPTSKSNVKFPFVAAIIGFILIALASAAIYSYSISNRYQRINSDIVFDKWTGKSIDVFNNLGTE